MKNYISAILFCFVFCLITAGAFICIIILFCCSTYALDLINSAYNLVFYLWARKWIILFYLHILFISITILLLFCFVFIYRYTNRGMCKCVLNTQLYISKSLCSPIPYDSGWPENKHYCHYFTDCIISIIKYMNCFSFLLKLIDTYLSWVETINLKISEFDRNPS